MMLVVVSTEERGGMILLVVSTLFLTSSSELSLWILFLFSDLGGHQAYPLGVKRITCGCTKSG